MKRNIKHFLACIMMLVLVATTTVFPFALAEGLDTNENEPFVEESTDFIPYTEFTFTGSNTGNIFNVPQNCTGRLMLGASATDGNGGTLTVKLIDTSGYTHWTKTVSSGNTFLETFYVGMGDYYFKYEFSRWTSCWVGMQFYTWTY